MAANNHPRTSNIKPFTGQADVLTRGRDDSHHIVLWASGQGYKPGDVRKVRPENVDAILHAASERGVRYWNPSLGYDSGPVASPELAEKDAERMKGKPYACIEMTTGMGFLNNKDAAEQFGVTLSALYASCNSETWTAGKTRRFRFAKPSEIDTMGRGEWVARPEISGR